MSVNHGQVGATRSASLPILKSELPRRSSFECPPPRSRRQSVEVKQRPRATEIQAPGIDCIARDGVRLEVGQAVDLSEQVRRLEANWNSEEIAEDLYETASEKAECSGRSEAPNCRSFLEQRWQTLRTQPAVGLRRRSGGKRRRHSNLSSVRLRAHQDSEGTGGVQSQQQGITSTPRCSEALDVVYLANLKRDLREQGRAERDRMSMLIGIFGDWAEGGLLSREAELELGRIVQLGMEMKSRMDSLEAEAGHCLPLERQAAAIGISGTALKMRLDNAKSAQKIFIQHNLRLLSSVAKRFEGQGMELADLIVDGTAGLERAIQLYDPKKGLRFATYAYQWVRQAMGKSVVENARVVRLPSHVVELVGKVNRAKQQLIMEKHIESPTEQQIADSLGLDVEKVITCLQAGKLPASLEGPAETGAGSRGDEEEVYLSDIIEDSSPSAEALLMRAEGQELMKKGVETILNGLSIRERNILRFRYGMHTEQLSLAELSLRYGLTKERVRQIGEIALAKLQLRQASQGQPQEGKKQRLPYLKAEHCSLLGHESE